MGENPSSQDHFGMRVDPPPRESELKLSIPGVSDFDRLQDRLGEPEEIKRQVNHYYDTAHGDLLQRSQCLRLREENGRFILTLKRGRGWKNGYLDADEFELILPRRIHDPESFDPRRWDSSLARLLEAAIGSAPLVWVGAVRNTRWVYPLPNGMRLELDATVFPGERIEYELEAEWHDEEEVREAVTRLLDSSGVGWVPQTKTKHQRFLEYLDREPDKYR
jgi:uncharacterized protein YjbK